jgi:hypothetical protein
MHTVQPPACYAVAYGSGVEGFGMCMRGAGGMWGWGKRSIDK